jgi:hypothetical protein
MAMLIEKGKPRRVDESITARWAHQHAIDTTTSGCGFGK